MTLKARLCLSTPKSFQTKLTCQDYLSQRVSLYWTGTAFDMTVTFLICISRGLHTSIEKSTAWVLLGQEHLDPGIIHFTKGIFSSLVTAAPKTTNLLNCLP